MSYVSLIKNIPDILSQPIGIAAIASLGLHGAIALLLPLMPVESKNADSKESAKPQTVGVVKLNPSEQNRLPQTATPPAGLQPLQDQIPQQLQETPPSDLIGEAAPLPPSPSVSPPPLPPLTTSPNSLSITSMPNNQSFGQLPATPGLQANTPFKDKIGGADQPVPQANNDVKLGASKPLPSSNLPETPAAPLPSASGSPELQAAKPSSSSNSKLPQLQAAKIPDGLPETSSVNASETTPTATPVRDTTPQTTPPERDTSQQTPNQPLLFPVGETPQARENLALTGNSLPQWQQETSSKTPDLLPSRTTTRALTQVNSYLDLRKLLRQQYPNAEEKAVIRRTISTDKPGVVGTVLGGLVVDPDGKVIDVKFQNKVISPELQTQVREYFNSNPPKGHTKLSYYPFNLRFQNNSIIPQATTGGITSVTPAAPKPLSESLRNLRGRLNSNPTTPKPLNEATRSTTQPLASPQATPKPLNESASSVAQPLSSADAVPKPSSQLNVTGSKSAISPEDSKKLIRRLRELRKQRADISN